jgi:hypothetical protein
VRCTADVPHTILACADVAAIPAPLQRGSGDPVTPHPDAVFQRSGLKGQERGVLTTVCAR